MDPYTFLELFATLSGNNSTGWFDPTYVRMLEDANRTLDPAETVRASCESRSYMLEVQPVIPLLTRATDWMKKPYVKGLYPNPSTLHAWKFVYIEHDPAKWDYGMPELHSRTPSNRRHVSFRRPPAAGNHSDGARRHLADLGADPARTWQLLRSERALPAAIEQNIRAKYGLDLPWYVQYGKMMANTMRGDFGTSLRYEGRTVNEILGRTMPVSAAIGLSPICWPSLSA